MADIITRVITPPSSPGHISPLGREKGRQGKGAFTKESSLRTKSALLSSRPSASQKEQGKGNVLDIRV